MSLKERITILSRSARTEEEFSHLQRVRDHLLSSAELEIDVAQDVLTKGKLNKIEYVSQSSRLALRHQDPNTVSLALSIDRFHNSAPSPESSPQSSVPPSPGSSTCSSSSLRAESPVSPHGPTTAQTYKNNIMAPSLDAIEYLPSHSPRNPTIYPCLQEYVLGTTKTDIQPLADTLKVAKCNGASSFEELETITNE